MRAFLWYQVSKPYANKFSCLRVTHAHGIAPNNRRVKHPSFIHIIGEYWATLAPPTCCKSSSFFFFSFGKPYAEGYNYPSMLVHFVVIFNDSTSLTTLSSILCVGEQAHSTKIMLWIYRIDYRRSFYQTTIWSGYRRHGARYCFT